MSKKILVADDSVVIQKSIGITFAQEDFDVTFVGNGEEALARAKEMKPDLILADTSMPKLSGAELCKRFRQEAELRRTPIMLLSGAQENFTPAQLKSFGADDFIQKPFESGQLLNKVKPLLTQPTPEVTLAASKFEEAPDLMEGDTVAKHYAPPSEQEAPSMEFEPLLGETKPSIPSPSSIADTKPNMDALSLDMDGDDDDNADFVPIESFEPAIPTTKVLPKDQKKEPAKAAPAPSAAAPASSLQLSEQQIEQIVAKVFHNVIERIAWEVVPEIAERIIKEEIAKITSDK